MQIFNKNEHIDSFSKNADPKRFKSTDVRTFTYF